MRKKDARKRVATRSEVRRKVATRRVNNRRAANGKTLRSTRGVKMAVTITMRRKKQPWRMLARTKVAIFI